MRPNAAGGRFNLNLRFNLPPSHFQSISLMHMLPLFGSQM